MAALAWLRRLVVSVGIGTTSYVLMLGIMILSVVYDRELEPVITSAFNLGRRIVSAFDELASGSHWGQVAMNHLRERVNMTHVVLSIPAIIVATIVVGYPVQSASRGDPDGVAAHRNRPRQHPSHGRARGRPLHLQRPDARRLCRVVAICRLDLASLARCAKRRG